MNKLQYICMSLPFGLKIGVNRSVKSVVGVYKRHDGRWYISTEFGESYSVDSVSPILRKLKHYQKMKKVNGVELFGYIATHSDVFGLIESGDAIDANELAVNPYER